MISPRRGSIIKIAEMVPDFLGMGRRFGVGSWNLQDENEDVHVGLLLDKVPIKNDGAIRMVTANVTTLLQPGRRQLVEQLMFEADVDIAGIQEARCRTSCKEYGMYYDMFSSAATSSGCYGVQLWVRSSLKAAKVDVEPLSPRCLSAVVELSRGKRPSVIVWACSLRRR